MKKQIHSFKIHKTALAFSVTISLTVIPLMFVMFLSTLANGFYISTFILMILGTPILYFVFSYLFGVFFCWIYNNFVSMKVAKITFRTEDLDS